MTDSDPDPDKYDLYDYYIGTDLKECSEKYNTLFLKANTKRDVVKLIEDLLSYEVCGISPKSTFAEDFDSTELEDESLKFNEWMIEWGSKKTPLEMINGYSLFEYKLLLFESFRFEHMNYLLKIFNGIETVPCRHLGYDNPFEILLYGSPKLICAEILNNCYRLISYSATFQEQKTTIENEDDYTPPVRAAELAGKLGISESTISNRSRPLGKLFHRYAEMQGTKTPRLPYKELYEVCRSTVLRSEKAEDLKINSINDLIGLWM